MQFPRFDPFGVSEDGVREGNRSRLPKKTPPSRQRNGGGL